MTGTRRSPETYILHRPPILCLESILELADERAVCAGTVVEGPHVRGGEMWEEGLIEGLAQTAGVLNGRHQEALGRRQGVGMLVGLRKLRFLRRARVGEQIRYEVDLVRRLDPFTLIDGRATVGREVLAEGRLKFYLEEGS